MTGPDDVQVPPDTHPRGTTAAPAASGRPAHMEDPASAEAGADPDDEYEPL